MCLLPDFAEFSGQRVEDGAGEQKKKLLFLSLQVGKSLTKHCRCWQVVSTTGAILQSFGLPGLGASLSSMRRS